MLKPKVDMEAVSDRLEVDVSFHPAASAKEGINQTTSHLHLREKLEAEGRVIHWPLIH